MRKIIGIFSTIPFVGTLIYLLFITREVFVPMLPGFIFFLISVLFLIGLNILRKEFIR